MNAPREIDWADEKAAEMVGVIEQLLPLARPNALAYIAAMLRVSYADGQIAGLHRGEQIAKDTIQQVFAERKL